MHHLAVASSPAARLKRPLAARSPQPEFEAENRFKHPLSRKKLGELVAALEHEEHEARGRENVLHGESERWRRDISIVRSENEALAVELRDAHGEMRTMQHSMKATLGNCERVVAQKDQAIAQLRQQLNEALTRIDAAEQKYERTVEEMLAHKRETEAILSEVQRVQQCSSWKTAQIAEHETSMAQLEQQLQQTTVLADGVHSRTVAVEASNARLASENDLLERKYNKIRKHVKMEQGGGRGGSGGGGGGGGGSSSGVMMTVFESATPTAFMRDRREREQFMSPTSSPANRYRLTSGEQASLKMFHQWQVRTMKSSAPPKPKFAGGGTSSIGIGSDDSDDSMLSDV